MFVSFYFSLIFVSQVQKNKPEYSVLKKKKKSDTNMHERCQTTSLNSSLRRSCVLGDDVHFKEASRALMETPPPEQEPGKCCKKKCLRLPAT